PRCRDCVKLGPRRGPGRGMVGCDDRNEEDGRSWLMTVPEELTQESVRQALRQVKDPELDMNIIDLGLVYDVEIAGGDVRVNMTLTSPGCPAGPMITNDAYRVLRGLEGVKDVDI